MVPPLTPGTTSAEPIKNPFNQSIGNSFNELWSFSEESKDGYFLALSAIVLSAIILSILFGQLVEQR